MSSVKTAPIFFWIHPSVVSDVKSVILITHNYAILAQRDFINIKQITAKNVCWVVRHVTTRIPVLLATVTDI